MKKTRAGKQESRVATATASDIQSPSATYVPRRSSRDGVTVFALAVFIAAVCLVLMLCVVVSGKVGFFGIMLSCVAGFVAASCIRIAPEWERVVVLRCGRFNRVVGPGLYFTIPALEYGTIHVDQRVVATPFNAESTLTADLVPVGVDAVLYWVVRDPEKACIEVEDYFVAVSCLAQTALREAIGRSSVAEVALRRDQLDAEIKRDVEKEASNWGVDIVSVKVRDIVIPEELQRVMSLEARADRETSARMAVAGIEADLAEALSDAARIYDNSEVALKLRTMLMQYETVRESGGTVFTVPSAISDGFVDGSTQGVKRG
ncbi:slipin family protein [Slackia piriformis]|uniref:slipin family protein n=1 Tax=Slackia piriformis TaxID=626934 RepID=UPI0026DBCC95|nr:slipin family protein [Slackia piriformis]MDO5024681.1 slipin family protein [Slackia piriformis]